MRVKSSRIKMYTCDASELLGIIKESVTDTKLEATTEEIANDWINIVLRNVEVVPVHMNDRVLSEMEHYDLLDNTTILQFEDELIHTIQPMLESTELGTPTLHHRIIDGNLEFYYHRN